MGPFFHNWTDRVFFSEPLPENRLKNHLCLTVTAQVPPPPSCCCLCHSPRCQLTPLAPPAPVLWCLCLLSAGASSLCSRLLLSTGAFTSASCPTSHHNSASRCAPLVWLVVAIPSASASPSRRASAWRPGLCHSLCLNHLPRPSHVVGCRVAQRRNPHLVAIPPGASASTSC